LSAIISFQTLVHICFS